jgi:hypothetical protein
MTWKQDTENPRIKYIDIRIPSCLGKKNKRTLLDFSIVLNDTLTVNTCKINISNYCTVSFCKPCPTTRRADEF